MDGRAEMEEEAGKDAGIDEEDDYCGAWRIRRDILIFFLFTGHRFVGLLVRVLARLIELDTRWVPLFPYLVQHSHALSFGGNTGVSRSTCASREQPLGR